MNTAVSPCSSPLRMFRQEAHLQLSDRDSILKTLNLFGIWVGALIGRHGSYIVLQYNYHVYNYVLFTNDRQKTKGHNGQM